MLNKVLFWGGLSLIAILFVENMVSGYQAYVFMDTGSTTGMLVLVSSIIGAVIGYGIAGMTQKDNTNLDDYDF